MKRILLHIQNMCCQRCIDVVTQELNNLNVKIFHVKLGEVEIEPKDKSVIPAIDAALSTRGFIISQNNEEIISEKVKTAIYEFIEENIKEKKQLHQLHDFLESKLKMPYRSITKIFSQYKKMTIEKFFILVKVEKTKDLIENSDMQFQEIADSLGYKSLQHLSTQFRAITGITMSKYKSSKYKKRLFLDKI